VITGDLDRLLAAEISAAGEAADGITSAGTWQPAPAGGAPAPGTYATPLAFRLAGGHPARAEQVAMMFAAALRQAGWVRSATVTGGYLTVSVTADALAALAVRITQAGPACARSTALAGTSVPAPRGPDLAAAPDWAQARRRLSEFISGRLAEAAGARILSVPGSGALDQGAAVPGNPWQSRGGSQPGWLATDENAARGGLGAAYPRGPRENAPAFSWGGVPAAPLPGARGCGHAERESAPTRDPGTGTGPVADAVAFAGSGAISYTLARIPPGAPARADPCLAAAHHLGNPAYAVRYAHAHTAAVLRQAADLGLGPGEAAGFQPRLLAHPTEQWLLDELSWLPERVAGAARRARPDVLTRYLERLAGAYFDCQEARPAMGPGIQAGGAETVARLWLAAAAGTALRAGLGLLGVDAPNRL
jgi:arginyl-tRNA synthetase